MRNSMVRWQITRVLPTFALLLPLTPLFAEQGKLPEKVESEHIFCGPFALDELFDKIVPEGSQKDSLSKGDGPTRAAIKKEMTQRKVYVIGRNIKREGTWGLTYDGDYPKILVEGEVGFLVKDRKDREYEINLQEAFLLGADMGKGRQTCEFPVGISLKVRRNFLTESEIEFAKKLAALDGKKLTETDLVGASSSFVQNFHSEASLVIGVDGKTRWRKGE
jgi:hypothetical protein